MALAAKKTPWLLPLGHFVRSWLLWIFSCTPPNTTNIIEPENIENGHLEKDSFWKPYLFFWGGVNKKNLKRCWYVYWTRFGLVWFHVLSYVSDWNHATMEHVCVGGMVNRVDPWHGHNKSEHVLAANFIDVLATDDTGMREGGPATRRKGTWPNLSIGSPDTSMVLASAMQAPESSKDLLNLKIHRHGPRTLSCSRKMTTQLFRLKWGWRSSFASERPQSGGEYALPLGRFTGPTTCAIFELQDFPVDFDYQWGGPETWQWAENERGWLWMHRPTGRRPGCRGKNVIRWTTHAPPANTKFSAAHWGGRVQIPFLQISRPPPNDYGLGLLKGHDRLSGVNLQWAFVGYFAILDNPRNVHKTRLKKVGHSWHTQSDFPKLRRGWLLGHDEGQQWRRVWGLGKLSRVTQTLWKCWNRSLGGSFKYFLFSPLFGEDFQFD